MKRRWDCKDDATDTPESSRRRDDAQIQDRANESIMKDDPALQPNHKIFLSHSGAQKDFVEELCGDLERRYHFPFFDKRPSSLPKGERFPELILKAAQQCQMAVVVVSEEYFTSKWPMLELNAFVQTRLMQENQKLGTKLKILPLFYRLTMEEFCNEERRTKWFASWDELANGDSRIDASEWKESLKVLASFNGIEHHQGTKSVKVYREKIVTQICKEVASDVKWDDSYVKGGSNICQVIQNKLLEIHPSKQFRVSILGLYGVGGIGKTTLCKILCNELCHEFKGKVSYIDIGSQKHEESSVKGVLKNLTNINEDFSQQLNEGQCWNILHNDMCKQKTFLALDNVWPYSKSLEEAKKYLQAGFHKDSVVLVASRALETLTYLGISESECLETPSLGHEDAKNLFLHHAAFGIQFPNDDDKRTIERCVARCYFRNGNREGGHYLPLALKALGVQLGCVGTSPSEWVRTLPEVRDFNYIREQENPVFSILRSSFDCLQSIHQCLFMDLVLYHPTYFDWRGPRLGVMKWLSVVYKKDVEEIESMLQHLKGRGLLEDVDMVSQRVQIHDLYREFAKLEARGKLNESAELEKRRWVYYGRDDYPTELEKEPPHRCWSNLIRIGVSWNVEIENLQGVEWGYFSNVVVLKLVGLSNLRGELKLTGLKCLRSLELLGIKELDRVDGLQDLNKLACFSWIQEFRFDEEAMPIRMMEQLPASLEVLELMSTGPGFFFTPYLFGRCTNLTMLELRGGLAENLDFSGCASLQTVLIGEYYELKNLDFSGCSSLQTVELDLLRSLENVSGLSVESSSNLQYLSVNECDNLVEIPGLGQMVGLQHLILHENCKLRKLPDLQNLTRLLVLHISSWYIEEVPGLSWLRQLRELRWTYFMSTSMRLPCLSGFAQLETVDLSDNLGLSSWDGVFGDLPALRRLNLGGCRSLSRLPDLSRARNLEELDLRGSGVELGEEEICMLAALPLLHPLLVGCPGQGYMVRLDVVRRKVLEFKTDSNLEISWQNWTEWDERDLKMLPILARNI